MWARERLAVRGRVSFKLYVGGGVGGGGGGA